MPKALRIASYICRVLGWGLCLLTVADAFGSVRFRVALLGVNGVVTRLMPSALSGLFVFQTPFGGAFRGDFAVVCILFLLLDWILLKISSSLR